MPLVFRDGVVTVLSILPFQSTSHASSVRDFGSGRWYVTACVPETFCSPIHKPSGARARPLGKPGGLLKSFVVFAMRGAGRVAACWANAVRFVASPSPAAALAAR